MTFEALGSNGFQLVPAELFSGDQIEPPVSVTEFLESSPPVTFSGFQ
jgi:hypothetical protein